MEESGWGWCEGRMAVAVGPGPGRCPTCREMEDKMGQTSPVIMEGRREGAGRGSPLTDAKAASPCG